MRVLAGSPTLYMPLDIPVQYLHTYPPRTLRVSRWRTSASVCSARRQPAGCRQGKWMSIRGRAEPTRGVCARSNSTDQEQSIAVRAPNSTAPMPNEPYQSSWQALVALCAISVVICYADRSNISTAILPMGQEFGWDKTTQGAILTAFFGGYCATQLVGGQLADRLGAKAVLTWGVVVWSLCTGLTPLAATLGTNPLIALRFAMGLGEGVAFPAIHSLLAYHVPVDHRSKSVGFVTAASYLGAALAFEITPLVIEESSWQMAFIGFGAAAAVWLPFWLLFPLPPTVVSKAASAPNNSLSADPQLSAQVLENNSNRPDDPAIARSIGTGRFVLGDSLERPGEALALDSSTDERGPMEVEGGEGERLEMRAPLLASDEQRPLEQQQQPAVQLDSGRTRAIGGNGGVAGGALSELVNLIPLFKRKEVLAICIAQYTGSWGLYGLLNWLPTYFTDVYKVNLADLGGYTFTPYIAQGGVGVLAGLAADYLVTRRQWKLRRVRTVLQVAGMIGPAVCLILATRPEIASTAEVGALLITTGLGLSALTLGGVSANHLDIAPRHAGVVFGAGNTAATLAGFLSVPVTGIMLDKTESWNLVFGVAAFHYVLGAVMWMAWSGGNYVLDEDHLL